MVDLSNRLLIMQTPVVNSECLEDVKNISLSYLDNIRKIFAYNSIRAECDLNVFLNKICNYIERIACIDKSTVRIDERNRLYANMYDCGWLSYRNLYNSREFMNTKFDLYNFLTKNIVIVSLDCSFVQTIMYKSFDMEENSKILSNVLISPIMEEYVSVSDIIF